jgi:hypothetical protein
MEEPVEGGVEATANLAARLRAAAGLEPGLAALVAVLDAMERAHWPHVPLGELVARTPAAERAALEDALALAIATGLVIEREAGVALDPATLPARRGRAPELPPRGRSVEGRGEGGELAARLAAPGAAVVLTGTTSAVADALTGPVYLLAPDASGLAGPVRDAWLRGAAVAIDADDAPLDWIAALARIPVRLAIGVDARRAGEALAHLRRHREADLWQPAPHVPSVAQAPVPLALEPLVSTVWNGIRIARPSVRLAALRGPPTEVVGAASAIAAGTGVPLHEAHARALGELQLGLASPVVFVHGADELDELEAHAVAALLGRATGLVLLATAGALPAAFSPELVIDLGGAA